MGSLLFRAGITGLDTMCNEKRISYEIEIISLIPRHRVTFKKSGLSECGGSLRIGSLVAGKGRLEIKFSKGWLSAIAIDGSGGNFSDGDKVLIGCAKENIALDRDGRWVVERR